MYYFQVSPFSKNYRTLRNAEDADFNECMQCKRFHMDESCSCNITDAAVRIEGFWTLKKIATVNMMSKLYFKQDSETLGLVFYDTSKIAQCEEEKLYNLVGWQKIPSRHNTVYFN